jgi:hexokinase
MIPTYIEVEREIPVEEPVVVLDAGGTNFRVASVHFNGEGRPVIERFRLLKMPGVDQHVSKEEFFKIIAGYMSDHLDISHRIGFCFSYPIDILPDKDGVLVQFSKEIKANEVIGERIGSNLLSAIKSKGNKEKKHIVLLNDTVATLLAGSSAFKDRRFDSYVGFILGTGTNCCYIEKNRNIEKNKDLDADKYQIINVESGGFNKQPRGTVDIEMDSSTINPGEYTFEKMISGAYFGMLCLSTIKSAARDGLFSGAVSERLQSISELEAKAVNDFMLYPARGENPLAAAVGVENEDDREILYHLIDRLIERAAKLSAINLSSVVQKSGKGKNPCYPVCITADGSMFYGLKTLRQKIEYYMKKYLVEFHGLRFEFISVENAPLIGAAIAGLTN